MKAGNLRSEDVNEDKDNLSEDEGEIPTSVTDTMLTPTDVLEDKKIMTAGIYSIYSSHTDQNIYNDNRVLVAWLV